VAVSFVGLIGYAWWAGRPTSRRTPSTDERDLGFRLRECSKERGIDFVHHAPRLDPKLENVMPHVAGMGAAAVRCACGDASWETPFCCCMLL
jgi:hypothetical protein